MNHLSLDQKNTDQLLAEFFAFAKQYLGSQEQREAARYSLPINVHSAKLNAGVGASGAFELFVQSFSEYLSGSSGPNYFGFVTGGATPASLIGDWLTALYDQNAMGSKESVAPQIEAQAISLFRQLIDLPTEFDGTFVTGATMSSFVGLATARQWVGEQQGVDIAESGLNGLPPIHVLSGTPHSSIFKGMSMAGLGRDQVVSVPTLANREAVDIAALRAALNTFTFAQPCIVVANIGTVNTVDFDDLIAINELKSDAPFWLHVDAAFGGIAACSDQVSHFCRGLELADSITIDAHKWLNVPYDCAIQLTRHLPVQRRVFQNSAAYLDSQVSATNFVDLTPENSRRLRALSVWMTLIAYGKEGYAEIVERNIACAKEFGKLIDSNPLFELLAPVRLNGVCFTLTDYGSLPVKERIETLCEAIQADGRYFLTPTIYQNRPAMRLSVSNWQTQLEHVRACYHKLTELVDS